jgi:hypothetical protein
VITQFITIEVAQAQTASALPQAIAVALQAWGEPLRWAITAVDADRQTLVVEAIVTRRDEAIPNAVCRPSSP